MLKARAKASPKYVICDHQLPAAHCPLSGLIGGVDIDEFDHPISIGPGSARVQLGGNIAADDDVVLQNIRLKGQYIRSLGEGRLVIGKPYFPSTVLGGYRGD